MARKPETDRTPIGQEISGRRLGEEISYLTALEGAGHAVAGPFNHPQEKTHQPAGFTLFRQCHQNGKNLTQLTSELGRIFI